jgi:hypothetical protein
MPSAVRHEDIPPDLVQRLERARTPEIPMYQCTAALLLNSAFYKDWVRFLIQYRRRSPLLLQFIKEGAQAGRHFDYSTLRRKVETVEGWIEQAKADFQASEISFFWKCSITKRGNRQKHWRHRKADPARVRSMTETTKESIFHPDITEESMLEGLWILFSAYFNRFKRRKIDKAVIDFGCEIGFARGKATSLAQYEIGYYPPEAHCFPILATEKANYPIIRLSEFGLRFTPS